MFQAIVRGGGFSDLCNNKHTFEQDSPQANGFFVLFFLAYISAVTE